jgi:hypothetical protein
MNKDNRLLRRRKQILDAWRTLAPAAVLNGVTLEQFAESTKKPEEVRQRLAESRTAMLAMRQERLQADSEVRVRIADLVDAVKGNPEYGANSPLYSAFGYVPRDARKSGLTRNGSSPTPTTEGANAA